MTTLKTLFACAAISCAVPGLSQESKNLNPTDNLWFAARGSFHSESGGGTRPDGIFSGDYFNLNVAGHIVPAVSYRIRQRLTRAAYNEHNIFNATDFLWLSWQASPKFALTFGKQPIDIGGFEYDATPIDVYYWSKFSSGLYKVYSFGLSGTWTFAENQDLVFEFCESPLSNVTANTFSYNILWRGRFAPWWQTLWSANLVEDENKRCQEYVALGNRWLFGPVQFDLDLMTRETIGKTAFLTDWSAICKIIWSVGDWNICTKFGHEENSPENIDPSSGYPFDSFDIAFPAGSDFTYAGAGLEYFPRIENRPIRLHAVWYWNTDGRNRHNFDVGITWWMKLK